LFELEDARALLAGACACRAQHLCRPQLREPRARKLFARNRSRHPAAAGRDLRGFGEIDGGELDLGSQPFELRARHLERLALRSIVQRSDDRTHVDPIADRNLYAHDAASLGRSQLDRGIRHDDTCILPIDGAGRLGYSCARRSLDTLLLGRQRLLGQRCGPRGTRRDQRQSDECQSHRASVSS
jgi:hypothetical protein